MFFFGSFVFGTPGGDVQSQAMLQVFLNTEQYTGEKLMWFTLIHLAFVVSALFLAFIDRISALTKAIAKGKSAPKE
mgnify:CR=1 FL=1